MWNILITCGTTLKIYMKGVMILANKNDSGTMRSCFAVWNNPEWFFTYKYKIENGQPVQNANGGFIYEYGEDGKPIIVERKPTVLNGKSPAEMCEFIVKTWCDEQPGRTAFAAYCISAEGLHHIHIVFECDRDHKFRYSAVQNLFGAKFHCEYTRGNKTQVEDYINKQGKFEEKGEVVVSKYQHGEIKGNQGNRSDLDYIEELINMGKTPNEIYKEKFAYRRYEKMIKDAYYQKRYEDTPLMRDIKVVWHVGEPGSGKTYIRIKLSKTYGEDMVYTITDYKSGFDFYSGEKYLVLDEFRGQMPYGVLLNVLDKYKVQFHARYTNVYGLWNEVHICTVMPPEKTYDEMMKKSEDSKIDVIGQLFRRLDSVVYHYIDKDGNYCEYKIPAKIYANLHNTGLNAYEILKDYAEKNLKISSD